MKLHVVTACSRPENLPQVASSIPELAVWWLVGKAPNALDRSHYFLPAPMSVGGQAQKNLALEYIDGDDWVYFLDDDTVMHPDFPSVLAGYDTQPVRGLVFSSDSRSLSDVRVGCIDQGQYVLKRNTIGDSRIPLVYEGDGLFIEGLYKACPEGFVRLDRVLAYYNRLR